MPYGPAMIPAFHDGIERGLLDFSSTFIENQMSSCSGSGVTIRPSSARSACPKSKDPLIGSNDPATSVFDIPQGDGSPLRTTGFSSFLTTRAVAYCFLPSVTALQRIATLKWNS
jgi:hypothetical protein